VNPEPKLIEIGTRLFDATEKARMACIGLTALHVTPSSIPALLLIAARTPSRVSVDVGRTSEPKSKALSAKSKALPAKGKEPARMVNRIAEVMGDKPIAISVILSELDSRGWLPKGMNPRANVSLILCRRRDLFQRKARGVYERKKTIIVPRKSVKSVLTKPPTESAGELSHSANGAASSAAP
jgi:hypothetical protein